MFDFYQTKKNSPSIYRYSKEKKSGNLLGESQARRRRKIRLGNVFIADFSLIITQKESQTNCFMETIL